MKSFLDVIQAFIALVTDLSQTTTTITSIPSPTHVPSSMSSKYPTDMPSLNPSHDISTLSPTTSPTDLFDVQDHEKTWNFIVMADPHFAEKYASKPYFSSSDDHVLTLAHIYNNHGGDLVMIPGDTNYGQWDTDRFRNNFFPEMEREEVVLTAGKNCFSTIRKLFKKIGWNKLLIAIGDHELGDNDWVAGSNKVKFLPAFRKAFVDSLYRDYETGYFMYSKKIGDAPSTPWGSEFQFTSFAHVHKNVLIVTVDEFLLTDQSDYFDRAKGVGGNGVVTGDITGRHLDWFVNVLKEARADETVKHIIVQGHLPIIQPVRSVRSSSLYLDNNENSAFWKAMEQYKVDIYFSGEVHSFTTDKKLDSDLIQISSSANKFDAFLDVEVSDYGLRVKAYVQEASSVLRYSEQGSVTIDKRNSSYVNISSNGILEIRDHREPIIHYDFEEKFPLEDRPVWLMNSGNEMDHDPVKFSLIRGTKASDSFANYGTFGQFYDAQAANITLVDGVFGKKAGLFSNQSAMAIFGMGPAGGGRAISTALWFKTSRSKEMILFHYDRKFLGKARNNVFSLTIANGQPKFYAQSNSVLQPTQSMKLNDGLWHHIAVTMTSNSCKLSEVLMYVDGVLVKTKVQNDEILYISRTGSMSIGGLGYSVTPVTQFPNWNSFEGMIDEFYVWDRRIWPWLDLTLVMRKNYDVTYGTECTKRKGTSQAYFTKETVECKSLCDANRRCWGFETQVLNVNDMQCKIFIQGLRPTVGAENVTTNCYIAV